MSSSITWLGEVLFARFLYSKVTLLLPVHVLYPFRKEVPMHSPHLRSGELYSTSLRAKYIHELFGIFLHGRALSFLSLPHEFGESIISVCQYGFMDVSFIFCVIRQYCFIFPLVHIFVALVPGSSKCHLAISPFLLRVFVFHFLCASILQALQDAPGSYGILPAPVPKSDISLRIYGFFYWRIVLETKIWALVCSLLLAYHCF